MQLTTEYFDANPLLSIVVKSKGEVTADIETPLLSLILTPSDRVAYLEAAFSTSSMAHALMACVSVGQTGAQTWKITKTGEDLKYAPAVAPPIDSVKIDCRLDIGDNRKLHHVAILDKAAQLFIATQDKAVLWRKLRKAMSCPTLPEWGDRLLPLSIEQGVLVECITFGLDAGVTAYVLGEDAAAKFDTIVSEHVKHHGFPERIPV